MSIPSSFLDLLAAPAPGLVFDAHPHISAPVRAYSTPNRLNAGAKAGALRILESLMALAKGRGDFRALRALYEKHDGLALFELADPCSRQKVCAIQLLPIDRWEAATGSLLGEEEGAYLIEDCPLYQSGTWRVVARSPGEGQVYALFFDGEYEGKSLAGQMYSLSMDPVLGAEELVSASYGAFLDEIARDPPAFFARVGFTWVVMVSKDLGYGDPIREYLPDVRSHPALTTWPE